MSRSTSYHTVTVAALDIFFREARPKDALVVLLLHGFSSYCHECNNKRAKR